MNRRTFFAAAGGISLASAAGSSAPAAAAPSSSRTFVLVHGAWHGGWCWRDVVARLTAKGHRVLALSLTGVGDRTHLFGPGVTLATHVDDVVNLIEFEQAEGCTLVGHSYGGNVLTGVADRLRGRVAHYVFLDAAVPPDGVATWSWSDINTPEAKAARVKAIQDQGRGPGLPPPPPSAFGVTDPAQVAWVARNLRPMPAGTYLEPITLRNGGSRGLNRTYVACVNPVYAGLAPVAERVKTDPTWKFATIECGHDAMVIAPQLLTDMLVAMPVA